MNISTSASGKIPTSYSLLRSSFNMSEKAKPLTSNEKGTTVVKTNSLQ
jgi:hypothetical protein